MSDTETAARTSSDRLGGNGAGTRVRPGGDGEVDAGTATGGVPASGARVTRSGAHLAYNPAIDGLRGLAVAAVLCFHGGFAWARGGYLGVSTFFTLSGFLITSLVVAERRKTGRIRLTAFWARRMRRLFPASAVTLAGISLSALLTDQLWERSLRGDVLSALFQVANWHFLFDDRSYAELFASPSPVLHFWSLAIEEQFYWVFPLLAAGVFAVGRGSLRAFGGVLAALLAGSALLTFALGVDSATTIYYATPVRMGEILVGALLAVVVARGGLPGGAPARRLAAAAGVGALAVSVWAWWNIGQDSPRLYRGGLLAYALVSGVLVLAATVPGPVRRLLALEPLRLLGVISYGVYLFHWPIFLVVDEQRTGWDGWRLFALRVGLTLAVAVASYVLLERPIRSGWTPRWRRFHPPMPALAAGGLAVVAAVAVVVPAVSAPPVDPYSAFADGYVEPDPASIPPQAKLGVTIGDSTLFRTAWGLDVWGQRTHRVTLFPGAGGIGCGLTRGGTRRYAGAVGEADPACDNWEQVLPGNIDPRRERYGHMDFAFIQTGPWDVTDRQLPGDDTWRAPGDPVYDAYVRSEFGELTDLLLHHGLTVVWVIAPHIEVGKLESPPPDPPYPESDPARIDRLNEIIREVADEREGVVTIDLQGYLASLPGGEMDERLRPDGVHFEVDSAVEVADWLGPELLRVLALEAPPPVPGEPAGGTPSASTTSSTAATSSAGG